MKKPAISIIVPAFNEEVVIVKLLKSIRKQSFKEFEIIIVDDASNDKTASLAKKYADKVFTREHADRSVQRNFGAKKSVGRYLFFLDADMELSDGVLDDIVNTLKSKKYAALTIPERTVGEGLIQKIRNFEREMYMNEPTIEVARVFERKVFFKYQGYDENLTGPEDYDLPYRISKKNQIGRSNKYILHHEERLTLLGLLRKKFSYAKNGAPYAFKHPKMVLVQGTIIFRKIYLKHWKKFLKQPLLGLAFIGVRFLETGWAVAGFVSAVGIKGLFKTVMNVAKTV